LLKLGKKKRRGEEGRPRNDLGERKKGK